MEIRLLKEGYKSNENFYKDFLEDKLFEKNYVSEDYEIIDSLPDFMPHIGHIKDSKVKALEFQRGIKTIRKYFLKYDRDIIFNERFWHSYFCLYKRDYIIEKFNKVISNEKSFKKNLLKNFNWENYIYKYIIIAQYVGDNVPEEEQKRYDIIILKNLDLFNYIIKYNIFRNDKFLIKMFDIIDELDISKIMKAKIKNRPDLGSDERYGRRVVYEFNKSYLVVPAPVLSKEDIKRYTKEFLSMYYDKTDEINWNL